ncbi:uncharacterized protein LOC127565579 [Drosophila albomicans]|uniref:Uncharacterized protein LOC127565579 n=1 Tax=Drosophila albomicans TaxID=7291 RepID=A0A9C6SRP3_DROAB|nr:uncharacterized protein LOC127565579 [Drosophila albomicans]
MSRTIVCLLSVVICLFAYANRCAYAACYRLQLAVNRYAAGATPKERERERERDRSNARNCVNVIKLSHKKNHRLFSLIFNIFREYTNLATQTCPLVGNITVLGFSLKVDRLKLPLPTGVYLVTTGWILNKRLTSNLNITFEFVEDSGLDSEKSLFGH